MRAATLADMQEGISSARSWYPARNSRNLPAIAEDGNWRPARAKRHSFNDYILRRREKWWGKWIRAILAASRRVGI